MGNSNIVMYTTEDGLTKIEVTFENDTVWLSLEQMAELFQRDKSTVSDILPMLSEYWFDDTAELQRWENILHGVFQ